MRARPGSKQHLGRFTRLPVLPLRQVLLAPSAAPLRHVVEAAQVIAPSALAVVLELALGRVLGPTLGGVLAAGSALVRCAPRCGEANQVEVPGLREACPCVVQVTPAATPSVDQHVMP